MKYFIISYLIFVQFIYSAPLLASKKYIIKKNDTISSILWRNGYKPIYGKGNYVYQTLVLNKLTEFTAKKLYLGKTILLPEFKNNNVNNVTTVKKVQEARVPASVKEKKASFFDKELFFAFDFAMGGAMLLRKQSGALAGTNFNVLSYNQISGGALAEYGNYLLNIKMSKFDHTVLANNTTVTGVYKNMYLGLGYDCFLFGVDMAQTPMFKLTSSSIENFDLTSSVIKLSYLYGNSIKDAQKYIVNFRTNLGYGVSGSSSNLDAEVSNFKS